MIFDAEILRFKIAHFFNLAHAWSESCFKHRFCLDGEQSFKVQVPGKKLKIKSTSSAHFHIYGDSRVTSPHGTIL